MEIAKISKRDEKIIKILLGLWEKSVRATHTFLKEGDIAEIKKQVESALKNYSIESLCVNEQNPEALKFYEHMGFEVYKRSEYDEEGNHFPLLYMRLAGGS